MEKKQTVEKKQMKQKQMEESPGKKRECLVEEFNNVSTKISNNKPAGYINSFVPLLIVWFLEHTSIHSHMYPDKRPCFLRWPDDIVYNTEKTTKLFVNLKKRQHYKQKDRNSKLFIDHINSNSMKSSEILLHPIIDGSHWTLIAGLLNEEKWEFYDSVPNPMHKNIAQKIVSFKSTT
ncbi:hypothetical protein IEQ34_002263 [Dendrobium chrysotoxum]|uniref:Ubiquitin-like protease family profile domain-containing protein n=1 Tax=Dendrobium chrysotoxum TaxID=161865 RepID=A0AAV7HJ86_DENCH|nr:hypothetical protein IEQ34_002263 [Dendrobium chrysotoxum]